MLSYFIAVQLCWLLFYLLYALLFSRETHFRLNRVYLLSALLSGMLMPLLPGAWALLHPPIATDGLVLRTFVVSADSAGRLLQSAESKFLSLGEWVLLVYVGGVLVRLAVFLTGFWQLVRLFRRSERLSGAAHTLVLTAADHLPFSFGRWLFWNKAAYFDTPEAERQAIFSHEMAHIGQQHTMDILLAEAAWLFCWFSPLPMLFRNALRNVHEYLADEAASADAGRRAYGLVLLRQTPSGRVFEVSNTFIRSQLKKRIHMLVQHRSSRWSYAKYMAIFPLVMVLTVAFQVSVLAQASMDKFEKTENGEVYKVTKTAPGGFTYTPWNYFRYAEKATQDYTVVDTIITFDPETYVEDMKIVESKYLVNADKKPEFIGGEAALQKWLSENVLYPQAAKDAKLTGTVTIEFVVSSDGMVGDCRVIGRAHPLLDKAAFATVCEMPNWTPGEKTGQKAAVVVTLPIKFE